MVKVVEIQQVGNPEVMNLVDRELPPPQKGEVRVENKAIGLNFIDTYFRSGLYPAPALPMVLGKEGAGIITQIGENVEGFQIGDRVAYVGASGSYAEALNIDASSLVKLPDDISDDIAASIMLKGMTARYLLHDSYKVNEGDIILCHAAAGGVGQILVQWAKYLGAHVIGTVGSEQKALIAQNLGCDHVIRYDREDFVERVKDITNGQGVNAVYDSIGKDTFPASLDCLKYRGMWVSFGQSSGSLPDFNLGILAAKGSLKCTRPSLFHHIETKERLKRHSDDLFAVISSGAVKIAQPTVYALDDVVQAHQDLEARRTTGSIVFHI